MTAWGIAAMQKVNDADGFAAYGAGAGPTVAQYGGKRVAGGTKIEIADGTWSPSGMVVLEFESLEKAKAWYNSSEYQAVVGQRLSTSDSSLIFVDGE